MQQEAGVELAPKARDRGYRRSKNPFRKEVDATKARCLRSEERGLLTLSLFQRQPKYRFSRGRAHIALPQLGTHWLTSIILKT